MLGPHADGGDPRASQGSARAGDGIARPVGRPIAASESQQQQVRAYHKEGKSKRWIAESMTLSRRTVDTIINKADGTDRSTVKRRVKLGVPTLPQPKRAQVVIRPGYFSVVVWALVAPLLLAVYLALIGLIKDYTPDRYELSKSRHSSPTQGLATAPPSAPDTTSEPHLLRSPLRRQRLKSRPRSSPLPKRRLKFRLRSSPLRRQRLKSRPRSSPLPKRRLKFRLRSSPLLVRREPRRHPERSKAISSEQLSRQTRRGREMRTRS
jgi:hypothetical protein